MMIKKVSILAILLATTACVFAQSKETKKIAKQVAQIYCDCKAYQQLLDIQMEVLDEKISDSAAEAKIAPIYNDIMLCVRPLGDSADKLPSEEREFLDKLIHKNMKKKCPKAAAKYARAQRIE